jgi:hypothetical protein
MSYLKYRKIKISQVLAVCSCLALVTACKKDGNPNKLPGVNPADYVGTIDGYKSSDEVFPDNLVAQWTFDANTNEVLSNSAPTSSANQSLVDGGVRGKALRLNAGYLYYAKQFPKFTTATLTSWSISVWVKILNNGSKRTMVMQNTRPGMFNGNINFILRTDVFPASNTDQLRINPTFMTRTGGTQDNANFTFYPKIGADKWTHIVFTYDANTGVFNNWADGVKVGQFPNRGTGNNNFNCWEPNEFIIGSNYNGIPGKEVSTNTDFAPMTGTIDEIRIFDIPLGDAFIAALYKLGQANK